MMGGGCTTAAIVLDAPDLVVLRCCICFALFSLRLSVTVAADAVAATAPNAAPNAAAALSVFFSSRSQFLDQHFFVQFVFANSTVQIFDFNTLFSRACSFLVQRSAQQSRRHFVVRPVFLHGHFVLHQLDVQFVRLREERKTGEERKENQIVRYVCTMSDYTDCFNDPH